MDKTLSRREIGFLYEMIALCYLEKAGLVFKEANVTFWSAEIDLIMRDQKNRSLLRFDLNEIFFGSAADSINNKKQKRLCDAAEIWL
ncbi:YraN family protein [Candidatus Williamhamiltonella defendens]|uniref:YraN family protein n=1 Tax=Candidatus Williamhamiltonella defendens TaxID=138072 RepID=UPI00387E3973